MISTNPLPSDGSRPTLTEIASVSMSSNFRAIKLPAPQLLVIALPVGKYFNVPVIAPSVTVISFPWILVLGTSQYDTPVAGPTTRSTKKTLLMGYRQCL